MTNERLTSLCWLWIMSMVSFVAYGIEGDYPFLTIGSRFLTAELFLYGLGDRT